MVAGDEGGTESHSSYPQRYIQVPHAGLSRYGARMLKDWYGLFFRKFDLSIYLSIYLSISSAPLFLRIYVLYTVYTVYIVHLSEEKSQDNFFQHSTPSLQKCLLECFPPNPFIVLSKCLFFSLQAEPLQENGHCSRATCAFLGVLRVSPKVAKILPV
jgi:hypothetical protein